MLLTAALTVAWDSHDLAAGEAWLRLHRGAQAAVADDGGPFVPVTHDRRLRPNDRVRLTSGRARLEMARAIEIDLRTASDVTVDRVPVLHGGEALVRTTRTPLRVRGSSNSAALVEADSVVRLSKTLVYGAGVYRGGAVLDSARRTLRVPALRQAAVSAVGVLPAQPLPVLVDATDEWDRRYLGLAIELTRQLDAVSDGFSANVVTPTRSPIDVVHEALPAARADGLPAAVARGRRAGELLVGAAIATAADAPFGPVFEFRDRGAAWGLVALDQHIVDPDALFALLELALGTAPIIDTTTAAPPLGSPSPPAAETARGADDAIPPAASPPPEGDEPTGPGPSGDLSDDVGEVAGDVADVVDGLGDDIGDVGQIVTEDSATLIDAVDDTTGISTGGADATTDSLLGR